MRAVVLTVAVLALSLSAAAAGAAPQTVDVRISRASLAEGKVALEAGDTGETDPFDITFDFKSDGDALGRPVGVALQLLFGAYCRDRDSWVEAVLIAPSGQRWPAHRVSVPPGPDRLQNWSSGYLDDPALIEAVEAGGPFTLALQDDEGQLWNAVVIDTLSPAQRQQRLVASRTPPGDTAPDTAPDADAGGGMIEVVEQEPVALPSPPRPCPAP